MENDLSKVGVGDYIWTIREGWTEVISIEELTSSYPITTIKERYTRQGLYHQSDVAPSAFIEPPDFYKEYAEHKPCEFKKGDKVLVNNASKRRYFSHKGKKLFYCFNNGADEWSSRGETSAWGSIEKWKE